MPVVKVKVVLRVMDYHVGIISKAWTLLVFGVCLPLSLPFSLSVCFETGSQLCSSGCLELCSEQADLKRRESRPPLPLKGWD